MIQEFFLTCVGTTYIKFRIYERQGQIRVGGYDPESRNYW